MNIESKHRGKRLDQDLIKVRITPAGQYIATLPKGIAQYLNLKRGSIIKFEIPLITGLSVKNVNISKYE